MTLHACTWFYIPVTWKSVDSHCTFLVADLTLWACRTGQNDHWTWTTFTSLSGRWGGNHHILDESTCVCYHDTLWKCTHSLVYQSWRWTFWMVVTALILPFTKPRVCEITHHHEVSFHVKCLNYHNFSTFCNSLTVDTAFFTENCRLNHTRFWLKPWNAHICLNYDKFNRSFLCFVDCASRRNSI